MKTKIANPNVNPLFQGLLNSIAPFVKVETTRVPLEKVEISEESILKTVFELIYNKIEPGAAEGFKIKTIRGYNNEKRIDKYLISFDFILAGREDEYEEIHWNNLSIDEVHFYNLNGVEVDCNWPKDIENITLNKLR